MADLHFCVVNERSLMASYYIVNSCLTLSLLSDPLAGCEDSPQVNGSPDDRRILSPSQQGLVAEKLTAYIQTPKCFHISSVNESNLKRMFRKYSSKFVEYPFHKRGETLKSESPKLRLSLRFTAQYKTRTFSKHLETAWLVYNLGLVSMVT